MERLSRSKAIRMKCMDCCCDNKSEIRNCPATNCPLWRFRMGKEENDELKLMRKNPKKTHENEDEDFE